jgi:hypothetical protein
MLNKQATIQMTKPATLLLCLVAWLSPLAWAEDTRVQLVLSDSTPPYQSFANTLGQFLPGSIRITQEPNGGGYAAKSDLVVAVGMKAMESALTDSGVPVLGVMLHKRSYEALLEKTNARGRVAETSAIYLNQPWERQLDFIQAALPGRRRIGLLHSPDTHLELAGLRESFADRGMTLVAQPVRSSELLFATLDELLNKTDALLSIPDSSIYNASNVRNILLTSYRHKVPLVGISQAYVNAGALGAIFSTPEQLAEQTGAALVYFARNRRLPEPQYPASYSIALNPQVARSLGIDLPSPEAIRERMNKAREGR